LAADIATRGETGAHQAAAYGALHVTATRLPDSKGARVRIHLAPGWHVNSIAPNQDFLLPTKIRVEGLDRAAIAFPDAVERKLGFHDEPLSLYEGAVDIRVALPAGPTAQMARRMTLNLQACSDRVCLDPQVVHLLLPAAPQSAPR